MIDFDSIRGSIPEECEISLVHAMQHLEDIEGELGEDKDQAIHNLMLAGSILLILGYEMGRELYPDMKGAN